MDLQAGDTDLLLLENSGEGVFLYFLHNHGRCTNLASAIRALAAVPTRFVVFLRRSRRRRGKGGKGRNRGVSRDLKNRLREREERELERSEC